MKLSDPILPIVDTVKQIIQEKIVNGTLLQQVTTNIKEYIDKHPPISNTEQAVMTQNVREDIEGVKKNFLEKVKCTFGLFAFVLSRLPNKLSKFVSGAVILSVFLSACQTEGKLPTEVNNKPAAISAGLSTDPSVDLEKKKTITVELPATVTAETLSTLKTEIDARIAEAAEAVDPITKIKFNNLKRGKAAAALFAKSLTSPENPKDRVLDPNSFYIGISPDGFIYLRLEVDSVWGKAGKVAIIDNEENEGLLVTLNGAGLEKGELSLEEAGYYATAKNESGETVAVVDATRQWIKDLDSAEKLKEVDVIAQLVESFVKGEIDFPENLTKEQYSAFIKEMNTQRGPQPIWVEAVNGKTGGKITIYLNKESRKMESLPGSYQENKAVIDQNSYPLYAEVYQEKGQDLQYVHPDTGELMTLPDSADVDWTHVVNAKNFSDGYMQFAPGKVYDWFKNWFATEKNSQFSQAILLDRKPITLISYQGSYWDYFTLNTLFMRTDKNGKPLYAVRVFYGSIGDSHVVCEENNPKYERIEYLLIKQSPKELNKLQNNHLYFVEAGNNQNQIWQEYKRGSNIEDLENLVSPSQAYEASINDPIPDDGNVFLAGATIFLRNKK